MYIIYLLPNSDIENTRHLILDLTLTSAITWTPDIEYMILILILTTNTDIT